MILLLVGIGLIIASIILWVWMNNNGLEEAIVLPVMMISAGVFILVVLCACSINSPLYSYESPDFVEKTPNGMTVATLDQQSFSSTLGKFYVTPSTNIFIKVTSGSNVYGVELDSEYEMVIGAEDENK